MFRAAFALAALLAGSAGAAPIEVLPYPAFFVSTPRGVAKTATLEIVNRETDPVEVSILEQPSGSTVSLEPIEAGRRYRLVLTVPADAPPGRKTERLSLKTTSASKPLVRVGVNTLVRERVHTFPDAVDLGSLKRSQLAEPGAAPNALAQTLMVYQSGGHDFSVKAKSDIPGLEMRVEPGPQGDRVQVTIQLARNAGAGAIDGTLSLETNDPAFRELRIPVRGAVAE